MIDIQVKGLIELQRKTEKMVRDIHGAPMLNAMRDSTLLIQRKARINAPVDTGRLKSSIIPEIHAAQNDIIGVVGSIVEYAPYQEFGTGVFAMFPTARSWKRGGIRPKLYLTRAFETSRDAIIHRFDRAIKEIIK